MHSPAVWHGACGRALAGIADVLSVAAAAETRTGDCGTNGDNVTWSFDTETGVLTISGMGEMEDYGDEEDHPAPWFDYNDLIQSVSVISGVTNVGDYAFYMCESLITVSIPDIMHFALFSKHYHRTRTFAGGNNKKVIYDESCSALYAYRILKIITG